ncbi:expressed unknown protein [Seminavis robusta]|uniref:Uncharacterized protein n=1 Tax=Seminavis robusta TaxID=568900 RepID=A0A9N8HCE4_9STRA|nr:expressed unknown protein [Seminavis robusta]|eukprot:Sro316_g344621.1  (115) ;mRNA; r:5482-5826
MAACFVAGDSDLKRRRFQVLHLSAYGRYGTVQFSQCSVHHATLYSYSTRYLLPVTNKKESRYTCGETASCPTTTFSQDAKSNIGSLSLSQVLAPCLDSNSLAIVVLRDTPTSLV